MSVAHYYNEYEPYAAQWLRNLIAKGHLPDGWVDDRSIVDVKPDDLRGFVQAHFFAGIGGWALAARIAGWPIERELWTGSAPCQPFSVAGTGTGMADARHLWPHYFRLIGAIRPEVALGEQVSAAIGKGWLDRVFADLESIDYEPEQPVVVPACSVNAPHERARLFWMAHAAGARRGQAGLQASRHLPPLGVGQGDWPGHAGATGNEARNVHGLANGNGTGLAQRPSNTVVLREANQEPQRQDLADDLDAWRVSEWISGYDGKYRRVEPTIRLLANGVPCRVGRLRAYGNAIVPQVGALMLQALMETRP